MDAWYKSALSIEEALLNHLQVAGASVDVLKCFDQINRPLMYHLLSLRGFPKRILHAYSNFMEQHVVHNAVAGGLGEAHRHHVSIPQGCPWSMTFVGFLTRPWVLKCTKLGATPRILADDMLVDAIGPNHESIFEKL